MNGSTVFQGNNGINVYSVSSGGQLSLVPGSPFDAITGTFFEKQYLGLQAVGSLLFGEFNTVKDAGNITVFSIAPNGALTRKGEVGSGQTPPSWAVHPNARFVYEVCCSVGVNVFSFDPDTGSSTLVQQVSDPSEGEISLDPSAKFLHMHDNGIPVFSIDQGSGKLTEVAGSPFVAGDTSVLATKFAPGGHFLLVKRRNSVTVMAFNTANGTLSQAGSPFSMPANISGLGFDPSGRFLVVEGANAVNILSFNADTGALTQVGPTYAVGDNLQTIAFATF